MRTLFVESELTYTGEQIGSEWARRHFDLEGDCIVAFVGPCDVAREHMVDLVDLRAGASIVSRSMLHFVIEHFDRELETAVWRQRLFAEIVRTELRETGGPDATRNGDDLYDGPAKLTVSVATRTPLSTKIHFGINVDATGAPVEAKGLSDYGIAASPFADVVLERYAAEVESVRFARDNVRDAP